MDNHSLSAALDTLIQFYARGVLLIDQELNIQYVSRGLDFITVGDSIGKVSPELETRMYSHMVALLRGEKQFFSVYVPTLNQEVFIHSSFVPGDPPSILIVFDEDAENITNRRLKEAIEHAEETIIITDVRGKIVYANPAFQKITGYSTEEAIGRTPAILKSGRHDSEYYKQIWDTILDGNTWTGTFINKRKDGRMYEEQASISPVFNDNGQINNFVGVKKDISHERELERQLGANHRLKALGTFAGGIAHDFNNILISILGYADLVAAKEENPTLKNYAKEIIIAAERGKDLVSQVTSFARQKKGSPEIQNLGVLISEVLELMKPAIPKTIHVKNDIDDSVFIYVQKVHIHQIVMNLITNSIQAMEDDGGLKIRVSRSTENPSGNGNEQALIEVIDDGIGMSAEVLAHIFDPFFTTKEVGEGTGLGLSVVHGIVKEYRGDIHLASAPGEGSCVSIYLPLAGD